MSTLGDFLDGPARGRRHLPTATRRLGRTSPHRGVDTRRRVPTTTARGRHRTNAPHRRPRTPRIHRGRCSGPRRGLRLQRCARTSGTPDGHASFLALGLERAARSDRRRAPAAVGEPGAPRRAARTRRATLRDRIRRITAPVDPGGSCRCGSTPATAAPRPRGLRYPQPGSVSRVRREMDRRRQADIFFFNLLKTEKHFSPTTMYADRAITRSCSSGSRRTRRPRRHRPGSVRPPPRARLDGAPVRPRDQGRRRRPRRTRRTCTPGR